MDKQQVAEALIAGPITDAGQLLLALVINNLTTQEGWAVHTRVDLGQAARAKCNKTLKRRIAAMVKSGYLEERIKPVSGVRLTEKALHQGQAPCLPNQAPCLPSQAPCLPEDSGQNAYPTRHHAYPTRHLPPQENASAYLPKRSRDLKEEDIEITAAPSSPSSGAELVLVADNPSPDTPRLDQPAAQPPAVVEQGDLLPVPAKRKAAPPKCKTPRKNPKVRMTQDWQPEEETLAGLGSVHGVPRAFAEALVWEFRIFWIGNGDARPGWDSTFIKHAIRQWKREQTNEQNAEQRQRYTDASGRRISESTRVMQDAHDNVLANPHLFVDFDTDTPF